MEEDVQVDMRSARKLADIPLQVMAEKLGVDAAYLSRVEKGDQRASRKISRGYATILGMKRWDAFVGSPEHGYFSSIIKTVRAGILKYYDGKYYDGLDRKKDEVTAWTPPIREFPPARDFPSFEDGAQLAFKLMEQSRDRGRATDHETFLFTTSDSPIFFSLELLGDVKSAGDRFVAAGGHITHVSRIPERGNYRVTSKILRFAISASLRYSARAQSAYSAPYEFHVVTETVPARFASDVFYIHSARSDYVSGTISALPTRQDGIVDASLFIRGPSPTVEQYFRNLRGLSIPAVTVYGPGARYSAAFSSRVTGFSQGSYLLYQNFLSGVTRPVHEFRRGSEWYSTAARRFGPENVEAIAASRIDRFHAVDLMLQRSEGVFRQICKRDSLERWVELGVRDDINAGTGPPEKDDKAIAARIEHTIALLQKHSRFEIAIDGISSGLTQPWNEPIWRVQGSMRVVIEMASRGASSNEYQDNNIGVVIQHNDPCDTFTNEFNERWSDVHPNKSDVISFFRELLTRQRRKLRIEKSNSFTR